MSTFLLIGLVLLLAAGVAYVFQNPDILAKLQKAIQSADEPLDDAPTSATRKRVGYRAGPLKFTQQMGSIPADSFITVRDPASARPIKMQVVTTEVFHGRVQPRGSKEWVRSGSDWEGVICTCPTWPDVLLLKLDKATYLFNRRDSLNPEEAKQFEPYAQEFAHKKGQVAGSINMQFEDEQYKIQDIGVWDVTAKDGDPHISVMARWIVAHGKDEAAIIIEDGKGNNDSIWVGQVVDLNSVVTDVLSSDEN